MNNLNKTKIIKALVIALGLLALALIIYLVTLPFYPALKYELNYKKEAKEINFKDQEIIKEKTAEIVNQLQPADYDVSPNRIIIPKIGVNAPIVQSKNADYALSLGSWHVPDTSTPDKGGNTVITGHRFKYLPPHNLTFYLFHKLETGDVFSVIWQKQDYYYRIRDIKIVDKTEVSILNPTDEPIVTLFTCHPIYSTKQRIVVVGELIK